eukprot:4957082-Pleurochrysis_carterae.AAC.1
MIIHEYQHVLEAAVACAREGARNVSVDEPPGVGRFVELTCVGQPGRVGLRAGSAAVQAAGRQRSWRVGRQLGQRAQARGAHVQSTVGANGSVLRRHDINVMF